MPDHDDYSILERLVVAQDRLEHHKQAWLAVRQLVAKNLAFRDTVRQQIEAVVDTQIVADIQRT